MQREMVATLLQLPLTQEYIAQCWGFGVQVSSSLRALCSATGDEIRACHDGSLSAAPVEEVRRGYVAGHSPQGINSAREHFLPPRS